MKRLLAMVAVFGLLAVAAHAADKKAPAKPEAEKKAAAAEKLTGEVVDITCFAANESKGEKHASCAAKCLGAGMPAGILAEGKLYIVTMKDHSAPNAKLAAWGGKMVTATGHKVDKAGAQIFEIDSVEPAAK